MRHTYARVPDEFSMSVFLQRAPGAEHVHLPSMDIPTLETEVAIEGGRWTCGLCDRSNPFEDPVCGGCGAPPKHAKSKGRIRLESWLPYSGVLYSLNQKFTLYITWWDCGPRDVFCDDEVVYIMNNCIAGPVVAVNVARGCIEEGWTPEVPCVSCDIACDCVYVGAPWETVLSLAIAEGRI